MRFKINTESTQACLSYDQEEKKSNNFPLQVKFIHSAYLLFFLCIECTYCVEFLSTFGRLILYY